MKLSNPFKRLTKFELRLWILSIVAVTVSFVLGGDFNVITLIASLVGVTALIFIARGDVLGQMLTVLFSLLYAIVSWNQRYYGEMITYLGMTAPIAVMSIISWMRHPYEKGENEVEVANMTKSHAAFMIALSITVTILFYFILRFFGNAQLMVSTLSITTSFVASYLMLFRNPAYALAYAANDVVLIVLWVAASFNSISYLPMVMCFTMFLINDIYGFYNWRKMRDRQHKGE